MKKFIVILLALVGANAFAAEYSLFAKTNLLAWCIVPFDAKKRGPEERAQMLERLGIRKFAYDWRAENIPTFAEEIDACRKHGIEITAWWFPTSLDKDAQTILEVLKRKNLKTQLWVMGGGEPTRSPEEQAKRVESEVARLRPIAEAAASIGCKVGLYNHGGWFGEPENQIAIIKALHAPNVGIVYNFHHGHEHLDRFAELFAKMQPYLYVVNINGMVKDGEKGGQKILTVGAGNQEQALLKVLKKSGWIGPIGLIDHRPETDSEETLAQNLAGLQALIRINPYCVSGNVPDTTLAQTLLSTNDISDSNPYTLGAGTELDALIHQRFFPGKGSPTAIPAYSIDEDAASKLRARLKSVYGRDVVVGLTKMKPRRFFARYESDPSTATEVLAPTEPLAICRLAVLLMKRD